MDTLRALRQPAAWVILGVVGAKGLIALVMMLTSLDRGVARAAQTWSGSVMEALSAVLVVVVVLSLVLINPRPPQTKLLVTVGVGVVAGLGVISLIGAFIGLADIGGGGASLVVWFLRRLLDLAIVALAAFILLRAMMVVASPGHHGAGTGTATQIAEPGGYHQPSAPAQHGAPQHAAPAQRTDAGAMWGSASQAASGSQASGWGSPQATGWGTPQSLPPQGSGTPHSLPPQPPPHVQGQQPAQQQPAGQQPPAQQPGQQPPPHAQRPAPGPGPADGGPPEDYTRIAPRRQY